MTSSNPRSSPLVGPARLIHLPRMMLTHYRGLWQPDPMINYIYSKETEGGFIRRWGLAICTRVLLTLVTALNIFRRPNYQIDGGKAFVTLGWSSQSPPPTERPMWILSFLLWVRSAFTTAEQKKRDSEYNDKKWELLRSLLPNKHEYAAVAILVADPSVQGKGYGCALMQTVCARADARQEKTWLTSTNAKNRRFYEASGFNVIGSLTIGEDNPAWTAPPPRIDIMIRLPGPLPEQVSH